MLIEIRFHCFDGESERLRKRESRGRDTDCSVPAHRSVRADFPHTALASGGDAQTARRIGTADSGRRQPAVDQPFHPFPGDASSLAPSSKHMVPELAHGKAKVSQSRVAHP